MASQHDRGQLRYRRVFIRAQPLEHLGAIEAGHIEIEQQERREFAVQDVERFQAIGGFMAVKTRARKRAHQKPAAHRVIIDD